jgi:hypothetical protein
MNSPAKWQLATFWDNFFTFCNFLHFHLNEEFQDRFYEGILRFQKWFDEDVLDFNPRFGCRDIFSTDTFSTGHFLDGHNFNGHFLDRT